MARESSIGTAAFRHAGRVDLVVQCLKGLELLM
jgi:hypothetical protein